ncbi:MAG: hypothetical protein KDD69_14990 [Bdellovibrionales bacterium]|nr:hypothetical protein [Bdellovibrionales bacterium]
MNAQPLLTAVDHAWQSVALEERLELISRAQATGVMACVAAVVFMGCVGYGFDQIWILFGGFASCIFFFPLFSAYTWRRGKPSLILAYLAVKAMARRYAYSFNVYDLDIILIYRGRCKEVYRTKEEEEWAKQNAPDNDVRPTEPRDIWICLMRGGVVILREKLGGAKLEFLSHITNETVMRDPEAERKAPEGAVIIEGVGQSKTRSLMVWSRYRAAHYVFVRQVQALIEERVQFAETQERLRQKAV